MSDPKYTFVVEHLDPELGPWSTLEYKTIAKESRQSGCHFVLSSVPQSLLETSPDVKELQSVGGEARTDSIETYYAHKKAKICLLDPGAEQELNPSDSQVFDVFLFGGILGRQARANSSNDIDRWYRGRPTSRYSTLVRKSLISIDHSRSNKRTAKERLFRPEAWPETNDHRHSCPCDTNGGT
jgi:ribosome biogenesis SPOUT family RNA methylase Rps3